MIKLWFLVSPNKGPLSLDIMLWFPQDSLKLLMVISALWKMEELMIS